MCNLYLSNRLHQQKLNRLFGVNIIFVYLIKSLSWLSTIKPHNKLSTYITGRSQFLVDNTLIQQIIP